MVAWVLTKINIEFIIRRVRREERPELPEEALREAVANAVAHRDYRSTANVQVYVFKDRIEIVSPGGLPAGMTEADLGAKSMPRNPLLFGMLYRMDAVENIGSGIKRIHDLCREHGVAAPIIDVAEHWVTVTFPRPAAQGDEGTGADGRPSTPDAGREAQEAQEAQDGGDSTDSNGERLQDWEIAVLGTCAERPATGRELLAASGYATRTGNFKKGVERLVAMDLLELTIPDKPRSGKQRYRLTAAGRRLLAGLEGA